MVRTKPMTSLRHLHVVEFWRHFTNMCAVIFEVWKVAFVGTMVLEKMKDMQRASIWDMRVLSIVAHTMRKWCLAIDSRSRKCDAAILACKIGVCVNMSLQMRITHARQAWRRRSSAPIQSRWGNIFLQQDVRVSCNCIRAWASSLGSARQDGAIKKFNSYSLSFFKLAKN